MPEQQLPQSIFSEPFRDACTPHSTALLVLRGYTHLLMRGNSIATPRAVASSSSWEPPRFD